MYVAFNDTLLDSSLIFNLDRDFNWEDEDLLESVKLAGVKLGLTKEEIEERIANLSFFPIKVSSEESLFEDIGKELVNMGTFSDVHEDLFQFIRFNEIGLEFALLYSGSLVNGWWIHFI